jgi:uncharacterized protein with PQ loop repeat
MYSIKLFGMKYTCYLPSCLDEYLGFAAIIIGLIGFFVQLGKTAKSLNVSSWSIYALVLVCISEVLFCIQGLLKKSWSISITRFFTFLGACLYIYFWFDATYKEKNKTN